MSGKSLDHHPCFNADVKGRFGRVHLPVASGCNIKCNYCNRKHDCVNESRPGVTSAVLSPAQALRYLGEVLERDPAIKVAGIAGPGDPMASPGETLETLRGVKEKFPDLLLCLATNGFGIAPHVDDLANLGVSHVTVTINAVDPATAAHIYAWVRDGKVIYRGAAAAELLVERQLNAVRSLKERGIIVKVNTIVIPGVNDGHVTDVARTMAELGADVLNCMPMYPNKDTAFADLPEPSRERMEEVRNDAAKHMPQMRHCSRCRADAVGLLGEDRCEEFRDSLEACSKVIVFDDAAGRDYVAVATLEGILVNQHLGEATRFQIWGRSDKGGFQYIEDRAAPKPGCGDERWITLAKILGDCRAVLVSGIGERPGKVLSKCGLQPVLMSGFIEMGLQVVYSGGNLSVLKRRRKAGSCGSGCKGTGDGC